MLRPAALVLLASLACTRSRATPPPAPASQHGYVVVGLGASLRLPPPYQTPSASNPPQVAPRPEGFAPRGPPGTAVDVWADDVRGVRWMALAPDGAVFATDHRQGRVLVLRDADGDGRVETRAVFATGLSLPFGLAFHPDGWLYVANTDAVVRFHYAPGQTRAEGAPERVAPLPGRGYNQHWTRNVVVAPGGREVYVTVGSETNDDVERDPRRAAVLECDPDGSNLRVYATGLRNPVGLAFHPATGALYTVVNERDTLGDDLVPDYLTAVRAGAFYGWPYAYFGAHEDPHHAGERPDLVARAVVPDLSLGAHLAALGLIFPTRDAVLPMRGDALVSLHGSWNRAHRAGYKVVRARFVNGQPTGQIDDFVTGWVAPDDRVWGRPVGLLEIGDGSILVADDGADVIWRVHR